MNLPSRKPEASNRGANSSRDPAEPTPGERPGGTSAGSGDLQSSGGTDSRKGSRLSEVDSGFRPADGVDESSGRVSDDVDAGNADAGNADSIRDDAASSSPVEESAQSPSDEGGVGRPPKSPAGESPNPNGASFADADFIADNEKTVISKSPPASSRSSFPIVLRPAELGRELEGEQLNHFRLEEFIGGGGMGAVFRAIDTELGRTVAVKVVSRESTDEEALRRFKNEAQSAARLDHPNIARVYYVGKDRGWNYIVFEYIEGVNIRDLVSHKGPLSLDEAIYYTRQVAEALDHACRREVVHRDIKPSNIVVMTDGRIKLVDMGLARLHHVDAPSHDLTASGVTLGTFDYISPEQARDPRNTDVRSDLYSLGCTLYFMLTGTPPFPEGTVLQKLLSHSSDEPPDPRQWRPELPGELVTIIRKLLAKQPDKRHQKPRDLIVELGLLAEELELPHVRQAGPVVMAAEPAPRSWLAQHTVWAAPTLLLAVVVLLVEFASGSRSTRAIPDPQLPARSVVADAGDGSRDDGGGSETSSSPSVTPTLRDDASSTIEVNGAAPRVVPPVPDAVPPAPSDNETTAIRSGDAPDVAGRAADVESDPARRNAASGEPNDGAGDASANRVASNSDGANGAGAGGSPTSTPSAPVSTIDPDEMRRREEANRRVRTFIVEAPSGRAVSAVESERSVESLSRAARLLREFPNVREIIVRRSLLIEDPFTLADRTLEIRAADGVQPLIVFGRASAQPSTSPFMVSLVGGGVTWRGLHFRVESLSDAVGSVGLFSLNQTEMCRFEGCSLTVVDAGVSDSLSTPPFAFLHVDASSQSTSLSPRPELPILPTPRVSIFGSIVRGDAVIVRAPLATPLRLDVEQSLVVTSRRLLETGGCEAEPKQSAVEINLSRAIVKADRGLCRMDNSRQPNQLAFKAAIQESIVLVRSDSPVVEHEGLTADALVAFVDRKFTYLDRNGCYPVADPSMAVRWRIRRKDATPPHDFLLSDTTQPWHQNMGVVFQYPWTQALPNRPSHEAVAAEFSAIANRDDAVRLGFDPAAVPAIPVERMTTDEDSPR